MSGTVHAVRVLRFAAISGFWETLGSVYTPTSWLFGLFARMLAQVAFFASLGWVLGTEAAVRFLFVGNAAMAACASSLTVTTATVGERNNGTLPLLVASPSSPLNVLMGRGAAFVPNGLIMALGAAVIVGPFFDVTLPWPRFPALIALLTLVALSTYMAATFLAGVVLRAPATQRTVANLGRLVMMAFCGVSVPRRFFPEAVQWLSAALPLTHGLKAVRELYGTADVSSILGNTGLEAVVGLGWLSLSLCTFQWLAQAGRKDGSLVFTTN